MRIKRDTDKGDTLWHPPSRSLSSSGGAKHVKQVGGRDWAGYEPYRAGRFKPADAGCSAEVLTLSYTGCLCLQG